MGTYRVVHVSQSREEGRAGWGVELSDDGKNGKIVSRLYDTQPEAQAEAARLTAQETKDA